MTKQDSSTSSDSSFNPEEQIGTDTTLSKITTRSQAKFQKTKTDQSLPSQASEQIKLALSVSQDGTITLKSISGRPPSFASTERQGLHTIAWAIYESMVEKAVSCHKPGTAFANILALSESLLGNDLTDFLIKQKDIDIEAFRKWHDELEQNINQNKTLDPNIRQYAINGKIAEIIPTIEHAIKSVLTNQNLQLGVAFAKEGNIPSDKDEGVKIRAAIDQLSNLESDISESDRKARQRPIITNIAKEVSNLFHYPYVGMDQQISKKSKEELVQKKEYRSLESFRSNDVNLFIIQLSNLLGSIYSQYPNIMGNADNPIYPMVSEAIINEIIDNGNWKGAIQDWHQEQENYNSNQNAISFLIETVNNILHTSPRWMGLFEGVDSEQLTSNPSSHKSESEEESPKKQDLIVAKVITDEIEEIEIDKKIIIDELRDLVETYLKSDERKTIPKI